MRNIPAASIFRMIQIALFPISFVGYLLLIVRLIRSSRKAGNFACITLYAVNATKIGHEALRPLPAAAFCAAGSERRLAN
jgi:hypothetical protein